MKDRSANSSNSTSNSKSNSGSKDKNSIPGGEAKNPTPFDGMATGSEVGVLLIDEKRKIVTANDVSATIFGTSDLPGKDIGALLKGGLQNDLGRILQQRFHQGKGNQRFSVEVTALCKGGSTIPVSVILTRNSVSNKTWWTALFRKLEEDENQQENQDAFQGATDIIQKHCISMVQESTSYKEELQTAQKQKEAMSSKLEETEAAVSDLEKKLAEQSEKFAKLESKLAETEKELERIQNGTALKEKDIENEIAQNERLKEELVALRQMCDDLTERLASEQVAGSETSGRLAELEKLLQASQAAENERVTQLSQATQELEELRSMRNEEERQAREAVEELEGLRQNLQALEAKRLEDQSVLEQATARQKELEANLQTKQTELEKAQSELQSFSELGEQEEWLQELRRLREVEGAFESDRADLEHRVREGISSLARATADLERERKERRRIEQRSSSLASQLEEMHAELKRHLESERGSQDRIFDLEESLREKEEAVTRLQGELREEEAGRQLAEEQLNMAGDMKAQVDNYRNLFEESKETFKRSREELEAKLQSTLQSLNAAESKLRQEVDERQRTKQSLTLLQERYDRRELEISRLESELQVERLERKQMEGDAAHSRYATLDSARANRSQASTLKRQLREPVDALMQSTRSLLEADLSEDSRKLVESLLENTLLVQTCMQEGSLNSSSPSVPAADSGEEVVPQPGETEAGASGQKDKAA